MNILENIDVLILCGGLGKRLKRVSCGRPKPMVKIGERPFIDIIISYLANFGFRRFILGAGYKANVIKDYYSNNHMPGIEILFSQEETPLDTGGAVKNAKKLIKSNPFFVLNGDSFSKFSPLGFLKFHKQKESLISILLSRKSDGWEYGEIKIDKTSRIINFLEKNAKTKRCLINAGVYIFEQEVLKLMPPVSKFSLEYDLFPSLVNRGIFGYLSSGFFIDIGTPERYLKAKRYLSRNI